MNNISKKDNVFYDNDFNIDTNKNNLPSFNPQKDYINVNNLINKEKLDLNNEIYQVNDENDSFIKKEEINNKSIENVMSLSLYKSCLSIKDDNFSDNEVRGYFLKKLKRYKYKGYLNNKKKNGFGKVIWEDKSILYGNFTDNKVNGFCKFINNNNTLYFGKYDNNRPLGYGIYIKIKEVKYEGEWNHNSLNGFGLEIWKDGTYYQGEYKSSLKNGIGLYRWPDGTIYQGEWENNQMNGKGVLFYSDDKVYYGDIYNGIINGFGEFSWPDGKKYLGNYLNGKKSGFGIFIQKTNPLTAYIGFWLNGKFDGLGCFIHKDNVFYNIYNSGNKVLSLQGYWCTKSYLKGDYSKYTKFFEMNDKNLIEFIKKYI